jgi:hypothetical protein
VLDKPIHTWPFTTEMHWVFRGASPLVDQRNTALVMYVDCAYKPVISAGKPNPSSETFCYCQACHSVALFVCLIACMHASTLQ